ncbi:TetR family transcriptional regulator [Brevundimonas sp. SPF441]|nr:TetR/AcrR family transcriptional regulator [Brevundimonas sp. SPF441]MRL67546.1 TetR family transcriptional regulator [Brevundimonas sp. SPF441]
MSIERVRRRRRTPDEARLEALAAARVRLLHGGPDSVTLKAVADDLGVTHANLIHHFGSAEGLQSALMGSMVADLSNALDTAIARLRTDDGAPLELINAVFDAFADGGAGKLAAWIVLKGDLTHLEPVRAAVNGLVRAIAEKLGDPSKPSRDQLSSAVLFIAMSAFGDALIGGPLRDMLGQEDNASRKVVASLLPYFVLKTDL